MGKAKGAMGTVLWLMNGTSQACDRFNSVSVVQGKLKLI